MKKFLRYIPLLIVIATSFGCEKEIPFKPSATEPKLVINSLFTSDSVWSAHISRSLSVLDTASLISIFDADVRIYDAGNNEVAQLFHQAKGVYAADTTKPLPGETYRIEVSAPGYTPVRATNAIPGAVQILSIDTNTVFNPDGSQTLDISLTFADPAGVRNYYMVEMLQSFEYVDGQDTFRWEYPAWLECTDPNIETDNSFGFGEFENAYEYLLLRDLNFDGTTYTLDFSVTNFEFDKSVDFTAVLSLVASSEDFFNYRRSYSAYLRTNGNPFAQPVQVYSNVEDGLGIFAGGARTVWEIDF